MVSQTCLYVVCLLPRTEYPVLVTWFGLNLLSYALNVTVDGRESFQHTLYIALVLLTLMLIGVEHARTLTCTVQP